MTRLLLKAHVRGYSRRDGSYVAPHEDKRPAAQFYDHAPPEVLSYRSGASAPGIMRSYIVSNTPLGVSLAEVPVRGASWDMMIGYAQRGGEVFVDSGAFTAFTKGRPMDWGKYASTIGALLHDAPGARLHIVVPDVVGDQRASLQLLSDHRELVRAIIAHGHDALVPVQKGELRPYDAWRAASKMLGTEDFTVSVPSNAAAFSPADLANLVSGAHKPSRIHLLGVAGNRSKLAEMVRTIHQHSPATLITSDAVRLRAQVGQGRPVTEERRKMAVLFKEAFAHLLEDRPELREAFLRDADRILQPAVAAASIAIVETRGRTKKQRDLFG